MARTSITQSDRFSLWVAVPLIAMLSIALWVQVIGLAWAGRIITSAIWAWVYARLPIPVD